MSYIGTVRGPLVPSYYGITIVRYFTRTYNTLQRHHALGPLLLRYLLSGEKAHRLEEAAIIAASRLFSVDIESNIDVFIRHLRVRFQSAKVEPEENIATAGSRHTSLHRSCDVSSKSDMGKLILEPTGEAPRRRSLEQASYHEVHLHTLSIGL